MPLAARALGPAGEVDRGPPRALHLLAPTSAASCTTSRSASTTTAGCSGLDVRVLARQRRLHAVRPDRPDHHLAPSCSGPTSRGAYRVEFESLYTNTVIVTPYRGAGRPQGCFAMERTMDAIAGVPRPGPRRGARAQLHPARRDPLRPRADLPGRPASWTTTPATSRPRWTSSRSWSAGTTSPAYRAEMAAPRAAGSASGWPATSRAPASAPTRARHVHVETSGKVKVATGLTTQGQGHQTVFAQIVADELGVPFEDVEVVTGDTRRMPYAVGTFASRAAVMSGSRDRTWPPARAGRRRCGSPPTRSRPTPDDLEIVDGVVSVKGAPGTVDRPRHGRGALQPAALRLRRGVEGGHPVRGRRPRQAAGAPRTRSPGWRARDFYSPDAGDVRQRHARGRSSRPTRRPPRSRSCATASSTTAAT